MHSITVSLHLVTFSQTNFTPFLLCLTSLGSTSSWVGSRGIKAVCLLSILVDGLLTGVDRMPDRQVRAYRLLCGASNILRRLGNTSFSGMWSLKTGGCHHCYLPVGGVVAHSLGSHWAAAIDWYALHVTIRHRHYHDSLRQCDEFSLVVGVPPLGEWVLVWPLYFFGYFTPDALVAALHTLLTLIDVPSHAGDVRSPGRFSPVG